MAVKSFISATTVTLAEGANAIKLKGLDVAANETIIDEVVTYTPPAVETEYEPSPRGTTGGTNWPAVYHQFTMPAAGINRVRSVQSNKGALHFRLWRVSDQLLMASVDSVPFDSGYSGYDAQFTEVALTAGSYRIGWAYPPGGNITFTEYTAAQTWGGGISQPASGLYYANNASTYPANAFPGNRYATDAFTLVQ